MLFALSAFAATTLAVLPFDNHSGDNRYDALGKGVADMMVTDLSRVKQLELVERARIQDVLGELKLGKDGFLDPESAAQTGKGLGADFLVVGAINAVDPVLRIDTRVVDVRSGRVTWTAAAEGQRSTFFEVEKELVLTLLEEMEIQVSPREAMHVGRVETESFDALLDYSQGLAALDSGAVAEARERFQRAVDRDAGFGAAKGAIEQARARVEASGAVRQDAYTEGLKRLFPRIEGYRTGDTSETELEDLALQLASQIHGFDYTDQRRIALAFLELDLPDTVQMHFLPPRPVNAWAMQQLTVAAMFLQRGDEVLTWGQVFLERYPTDPYFAAMKIMVDQQLQRLEKTQTAREAGTLPKLELELEEKALLRRCDLEPDRRRTLEACRKLWDWKQAHTPETWERRTLDDIFHGVVRHDPDLAAEVLELWTRVLPDPPHSSRERQIEEARDRQAASERQERAQREPSAWSYDSAISAQLKIGDEVTAQALLTEVMRRFPTEKMTFVARWRVARALGDADGMQAAAREGAEAGHVVYRSNADAAKEVEKMREWRYETDHIDAWRTFELAERLSRAGLRREAAERYEQVVTKYPDWTGESRAQVLQQAAREWNAVFEQGALERSIRLREQLIAELPESREAQTSAAWLARMRVQ